jgi:hypothetical protein
LKLEIGVAGITILILVGLVALAFMGLYGLLRAALLGQALPRDPAEE